MIRQRYIVRVLPVYVTEKLPLCVIALLITELKEKNVLKIWKRNFRGRV